MKSLVFMAAFLLPLTLAAPLDSEETVLTPAGLRPASSVLPVPDGGSINITGNEIHLLDASKNTIHVAQINHTKITPGTVPQESGWVAYASWYNTGSPISYFTTSWPVPPVPVTNHDQTIFLFNSIEPASFDAILQPVLQYGPSAAGGGAYWAVAVWYVTGSTSYYTPIVSVSAGEVLEGIIELTSSSGSAFTYVSGFVNIGYGLELSNSAELVWATETLESYGVTTGTDYPEGATVFSNIDLETTTGTPSVSWSVSDDTIDGVYATVAEDGATNAVVVINYET